MEKNAMNNVTEALGDALKLAANLSEKRDDKQLHISDDSTNTQSNPNQQVQIHIGEQEGAKKQPEPVVIHEKPETHIHKEFPDERALTDKECDLALEKAKMENQLKLKEMEYRSFELEQRRRDRLAREEQERKEREILQQRKDKRNKIRMIVAGILGAITVAGVGYAAYSDHKNGGGNAHLHISYNPTGSNDVQGEGTVE